MENSEIQFSINEFNSKGVFSGIEELYESIEIIGQGSYGRVCSAKIKYTNEKVAIKKITILSEKNNFVAVQTLREVKISRYLNNYHPSIVLLKDIIIPVIINNEEKGKKKNERKFNEIFLVYELMDNDLDAIIKSDQVLVDKQFQYILTQLLEGLDYMHSANILHRDLKPKNLLIDENVSLRICDFGFSCVMRTEPDQMSQYVVTRYYRAPELLLGCRSYDASIDMWSVGCIFGELLKREPIFPGENNQHELELIISFLGAPPDDDDLDFIDIDESKDFMKKLLADRQSLPTVPFSDRFPNADPSAIDLLKRMLTFNPRKRISVKEALQHSYLTEMVDRWNQSLAEFVVKPIQELVDVDDSLNEETIRDLLWNELLGFYRDREGYMNDDNLS